MYSSNAAQTGLGESLLENISSFLSKGAEAGVAVYDKVRQLKELTQARQRAQEQAKMLASVQTMQAQAAQAQMLRSQQYGGMDWTTIGLVSLVLIGGITLLRR